VPGAALIARLARLAAAQGGVVSRGQLLELGFTNAAIGRMVARGHLIRVRPGVYAVGHDRLSAQGRWMAAVLSCGDGALLSHLSAAAHWNLLQTNSGLIHVSLPSHRDVRVRQGLRIHRSHLHPADRASHHRIPLTSPHRTLLDLAETVPLDRLREALEQSIRTGMFDRRKLDAVVRRGRGRHGLKPLRIVLAETSDDPPDLRSRAEHRLRQLILEAGLPIPHYNTVVEGLVVDVHWPQHGLVVEIDGYSFHRSRDAFERDHVRTERLQRAGLAVLRFTARRILGPGNDVVGAIRRALGAGAGG
jgi:very-short-patch-repair endonuclease